MVREGSKNPRWNGGKRRLTNGYIQIKAPSGHLHPTKDGYIYEHRHVMEQHLGRFLDKKEIVHHINKVPSDNRIENLEVFANHGAHMLAHHFKLEHMVRRNKFTICEQCGQSDEKPSTVKLCRKCYAKKREEIRRKNND